VNRSLVKYLPVFLFLLSFFIRFTGNLLTVSLHSSSSFSLHKKKKVARGTFETTFFCKLPKFIVDVNIRELVAACERSLLAVQEVHKKKKKKDTKLKREKNGELTGRVDRVNPLMVPDFIGGGQRLDGELKLAGKQAMQFTGGVDVDVRGGIDRGGGLDDILETMNGAVVVLDDFEIQMDVRGSEFFEGLVHRSVLSLQRVFLLLPSVPLLQLPCPVDRLVHLVRRHGLFEPG